MRLAVLTPDPDGPVTRHRVRALEAHLAAAGFDEVAYHGIPRRLRERFALFRALGSADVVLLQRKLFSVAELRLLRSSVRRLAYDVDDAVMYRDPFRGKRPESRVRRARFTKTVDSADLVTAGNAYLVEHARDAAARRGGAGIEVVHAPTPVDTDHYAAGTGARQFRVGWIGSRATRPYLKLVRGALARVRERAPIAEFVAMADAPPHELDGLDVEFTPWSAEAEVPFLRSLAVGIMPLSDDPFSRGKCGFKLLQYHACGVPSVSSPVGVNALIAEAGAPEGVDVAPTAGLTASDEDAWVEALMRLRDQPGLRARMGEAARRSAVETWSADALGPHFAAALARCATGALRP